MFANISSPSLYTKFVENADGPGIERITNAIAKSSGCGISCKKFYAATLLSGRGLTASALFLPREFPRSSYTASPVSEKFLLKTNLIWRAKGVSC